MSPPPQKNRRRIPERTSTPRAIAGATLELAAEIIPPCHRQVCRSCHHRRRFPMGEYQRRPNGYPRPLLRLPSNSVPSHHISGRPCTRSRHWPTSSGPAVRHRMSRRRRMARQTVDQSRRCGGAAQRHPAIGSATMPDRGSRRHCRGWMNGCGPS